MQPISNTLLTASHSLHQIPFATVNVDDPRIRGWYRNDTWESLTGNFANDTVIGKTGPTMLQIQALETGSPASYAVLVGTIGSLVQLNTVVKSESSVRREFSGVGLFTDPVDGSSPARVDAFYMDNSNPPNIKYSTCAGSGNYTSWSAAANVHGDHVLMDSQRGKANPQMVVAGWSGTPNYYPYIFYTSTSSSDKTLGTSLCFYDGSKASGNSSRLGLTLDIPGYGVATAGTLSPVTGLGAFQLNSTDFACVVAVNNPRGLKQSGIYLVWYRDGIWSNLYPVRLNQTLPASPNDSSSIYSLAFPRITVIDGVYWVTAVESVSIPGLAAGNLNAPITKSYAHWVAYRSLDGVHWTDGLVLAGTEGIGNGYWNIFQSDPTVPYNTAFQVGITQNDFANCKLLTTSSSGLGSGSRVFMAGYKKLWQLNNGITSLITTNATLYAANQIDLTSATKDFSLTLPNSGAGQATVNIVNRSANSPSFSDVFIYEAGDPIYLESGDEFLLEDSTSGGIILPPLNNSRILRHGGIVRIVAGYVVSSVEYGATVFTGRIDELRQTTQLQLGGGAVNTIQAVCKDVAIDNLDYWTTDSALEYSSSIQVWVPKISDYGSIILVQGQWSLNSGGFLLGQLPNAAGLPVVVPNLDILTTNTDRVVDGIFDVKFSFQNSLTGITGGAIFRYVDNLHFYHVVFNNSDNNAWLLLHYNGSTTPDVLTAPLTKTGSRPAAGEIWWMRVHLFQNKIVVSSRKDQTTPWNLVLSNGVGSSDLGGNRLNTDTGFFGFATKSGTLIPSGLSNTEQTDTSNVILASAGSPESDAVQFVTGATGGFLNSYAVRFTRSKDDPGGTISFYILQDDVTNPGFPVLIANQDPALVPANTVYSSTEIVDDSWTTVNVNSTTHVTLAPNTPYYIAFRCDFNFSDSDHSISIPLASTSGNGNAYSDFGGGGIWFQIGFDANFTVTLSNSGGAVAVYGYALYSADLPHTLNDLTAEIATKSGSLVNHPKYAINEDFSSGFGTNWDTAGEKGTWTIVSGQAQGNNALGAYGFLRHRDIQVAEFVMDCDMTIGTGGTDKAGFFIMQQTNGAMNNAGNVQCYTIEFDAVSNKCVIHACYQEEPQGGASGNIIFTSQPVLDLVAGFQYHVRIQHSGKFILVWLDDWLVASVREQTAYRVVAGAPSPIDETPLRLPGYVGMLTFSNGAPAGTFDNFVITELKEIKDYFPINTNTNGQTAMQNLHRYDRVKVFGDYDGGLTWGYYDNLQASGDLPYTTTIKSGTKVSSNRYWYSHIRPFGDYNADRYSAYLLDQEGTRFGQQDYTDVRSDRSAYHAAAYPIRTFREVTDGYEFVAGANPGIQREDKITITNALDGTNDTYIVDAVRMDYTANPPKFDMTVTCRKFISSTAEGAA